jgi:hypothetical protein
MPAKREVKTGAVEVELNVEKPNKVHNVYVGPTPIEFIDGKAIVSAEQAELLKELNLIK